MVSRPREELAIQVDAEVLAAVRDLALAEKQQLGTLVDEALADLIRKRQPGNPRSQVMAAYETSHTAFGPLYAKLAKAEDIMSRYSQTLNALAK